MAGHLDDHELLLRSAAGSKEAFAELVERHQAAVYRLAKAMTRTPEAAEDVLQETFLAAMRGAGAFRGDSSVRTWLLTIARHEALRLGRHRSGEPDVLLPLEELHESDWNPSGPDDAMMRMFQQREELEQALQDLSADDREILVLRELEGLSGEETARVLGITPTATKSRLHRARLRLAGALRQRSGRGA